MQVPMFIDTHTHLYTEDFDTDRPDVVARARRAGAGCLLLPNIDEASVAPMLRMCGEYPGLCHPMMGLHPTELPPDPAPLLDRMEQMLLAPDHPYVAVGETGIDLYWDASRREEQIACFDRQAGWAVRTGLPLVVHSRSAHREVVETLRPYRDSLAGGIFHCFGGTAEEAHELLETFPTFVLGIGGVVTFKKSGLPSILAATVPADRIVVETDAPYLAPTPHRGKRNESAFIPLILDKLAEVYGTTAEDMARQTTANACRVFPRIRPEAQRTEDEAEA